MTPEEFNELYAYAQHIAPLTDACHFDRIAEILKLGFFALVSSWGGKISLEDLEPFKPQSDGPRPKINHGNGFVSPDAAVAMMKSEVRSIRNGDSR